MVTMRFPACAVLALICSAAAARAQQPIELRVDMTDGPRHILHVTEKLPAHPGDNSFNYPEWIPGEHLPGGPIDNLTGIVFRTGGPNGPTIAWRRDLVDMFAFHVNAPSGTRSLWVAYDVLEVPSRADTTGVNHMGSHVAMLETSDVVLYPSNTPVRNIPITATLHLPTGWVMATALRAGDASSKLNPSDTTFHTVSVEQFVDSPIVMGQHCRLYPLAPEIHPTHTLDVCADKEADLDLKADLLQDMNNLVRQTTLLYRSHHYDHYDFLVAMSPHLEGDSLEHTQSADYVVKSLDLSDPATSAFVGYLIPHENSHSWCGKYRRPADLATPDYHQPMKDDLLWVYEGLTQYYGDILTARAGFRTTDQLIGEFDLMTYIVDMPGRTWRPLQDTADASSILRGANSKWSNWRLSQDYYQEGALIWLEADMKIRQLSNGRKSLDDFAALFLGATPSGGIGDTGPGVLPYNFEDVIRALNQVAPYDWATFWTTRLNNLTPRPPTAGLEAAGYTYGDSDVMGADEARMLKGSKVAEMSHSLGIVVIPDGTIPDVRVNSPAYVAGLGPGDKLTSVNGQPYSSDVLIKAVHDSKTGTAPIALKVERNGEVGDYQIDYHGGEKYAVLQRNSNPDILTTVIAAPLK
jgi:predicted metalloprotease with PDZ domain